MTDVPGRLSAALADRYRVERELGQGGMATVYLAHDVRHDRENLVAAAIAPAAAFRVASQRPLFSTHGYAGDNRHNDYSVSADDRWFFFVKSPSLSGTANQLIITLNWFQELRRKVGR
jgi:serine/threonine protein kinase